MTKAKTKKETPFDGERYEDLRSALKEHLREWERAARQFPNLYYQSIFSPDDQLSNEAWYEFRDANSLSQHSNDWEKWIEYSSGLNLGRFYGERRWFELFKHMAVATGQILTDDFNQLLGSRSNLPKEIIFETTSTTDYLDWLHLIWDTAKAATPMLHLIGRFWTDSYNHPGINDDELSDDNWIITADNVRYPQYPFYLTLPHNLFRSSAEAIRFWLSPDNTPLVGQAVAESPIKLPSLLHDSPVMPSSKFHTTKRKDRFKFLQPTDATMPSFEEQTRTLYLGTSPIHVFPFRDGTPTQQELIMRSFQKLKWANRIDNPLSGKDDPENPLDSKQRLIRAIYDFNSHQGNKLSEQLNRGENPTRILRLVSNDNGAAWYLIDVSDT